MSSTVNTVVEKGAAPAGAHLVRDVSLPALVLHIAQAATSFLRQEFRQLLNCARPAYM